MNRRPGIAGAAVLAATVATMLASSACQNLPEPYAPPAQREPLADFRPFRLAAIVDMSDQDAPSHFVEGITSLDGFKWRWTGKRPTVRVRIRSVENLRYTIDFALTETTLQATGPVTVSFLVNNRVLDRARYSRAGSLHFEKPVPNGWLTAGQEVFVGADIDKLWVSPEDGTQLGMVLVRMGLTQ